MRRYCSAGWVDITSVRCVLPIQNWSHPEHCPQQTVFLRWCFLDTFTLDSMIILIEEGIHSPHPAASWPLETRAAKASDCYIRWVGVAHLYSGSSSSNSECWQCCWYWSHFTTCQILLHTTFSWVPLLNTECLAVMSMVVMHSEWDSVVVMIVISSESW